jgi:hypothetical protein
MKKYIFTETQIKKIVDHVITEQKAHTVKQTKSAKPKKVQEAKK